MINHYYKKATCEYNQGLNYKGLAESEKDDAKKALSEEYVLRYAASHLTKVQLEQIKIQQEMSDNELALIREALEQQEP